MTLTKRYVGYTEQVSTGERVKVSCTATNIEEAWEKLTPPDSIILHDVVEDNNQR